MNVVLQINTTQIDNFTNQQDDINVTTIATMKKSPIFDIISYDETENTGMQGTKTVIKIENDSVTMIRYGKNKSNIYFKKDVENYSNYTSDYATFELKVNTTNLNIIRDEDSYLYQIYIEYDLEIKGLFKGKNKLDLKVKAR